MDREYEYHPLATIFPLLTGKAYKELEVDIIDHGMQEPAVIYQDKLLDGITRYRIAKDNPKVEFRTIPFAGDNDQAALDFVLSRNLIGGI